MVCEVGVAIVRYGGVLSFTGQTFKYTGGMSKDVVLDSDLASYAEIKGFLIDNQYVEADFRVYFKPPRCSELKILHSDESSLEFGNFIYEDGEVDVYVAHGPGINNDHIPYNGGGVDNLEPDVAVDGEAEIEHGVAVDGVANLEVGIDGEANLEHVLINVEQLMESDEDRSCNRHKTL